VGPQKRIPQIQRKPHPKISTSFSPLKGNFQHKTIFEMFGFRGVINETVDADSAVSMRLRKQIARSQ
jgi:hypothetical protein